MSATLPPTVLELRPGRPALRRACEQAALAGLLALLYTLPWLGAKPFLITLLTEALILGIWALSLDLLAGVTGLVSFGHAAAFGLATYAAGYCAREWNADLFAALSAAALVVGTVAVLTGFVAARLSGIAFAIVSLAIAQVLFQIAVGWRAVTQGMDGFLGVPMPRLLGRAIEPGVEFYLLCVTALALVAVFLRHLVDTPFGHTLAAIRVNPQRAAAVGIDVTRHKWIAFVLSWLIAGIAGTLFVFLKAGATPMTLHWSESGNVLVMTILGGLGTLLGPVVGAVVFVFGRDEFTTRYQAWQFAFGLIFVLVVLLLPSGLGGLARRAWDFLWRPRS